MPPEQLSPEEDNVELEAIAQNGLKTNESLDNVDANTEAAAVKLNEIEQNQEAQIMQSMKSTADTIAAIKPSLEAQAKMANIFSSLMTNLEGPPGKTPEKGVDYFTDKEIAEILNKATPKKGKDYFTPEEVAQFRKMVTPQKGVDYKDGEDGEPGNDGEDGRSPLTVSSTTPKNPQIGDLWYKA
jgi:aminopeptidase N